MWTVLISLMKGWGSTLFQFQSSALKDRVKWWSWVFLPCKTKQRWLVSYSSGLVEDQLISKAITYPFCWTWQSHRHFPGYPSTAFWRCWITAELALCCCPCTSWQPSCLKGQNCLAGGWAAWICLPEIMTFVLTLKQNKTCPFYPTREASVFSKDIQIFFCHSHCSAVKHLFSCHCSTTAS